MTRSYCKRNRWKGNSVLVLCSRCCVVFNWRKTNGVRVLFNLNTPHTNETTQHTRTQLMIEDFSSRNLLCFVLIKIKGQVYARLNFNWTKSTIRFPVRGCVFFYYKWTTLRFSTLCSFVIKQNTRQTNALEKDSSTRKESAVNGQS